jgi:3-hydroxyisobutyrate dehydrogenase-like beta-hydroxyacid dehydrogenase
MPPSQPTVGFIGLGHMGSGMTCNLLRADSASLLW